MSSQQELRWYGKVLDSDFKTLKIIVLSDLHYGNPYCDTKDFSRTIHFILQNPDCYCFMNGDFCESALRTSKGEIYRQVGTPQEQRDWVIEQMYPIRDKVLGITTGNHENRITSEVGIDISSDIAQSLGVPYRAEGMLFKLSFGDNNNSTKGKPFVFWSYITHGYGGARTKSAKAVKVERLSSWIHADWYAMSHDHVVNVAPDIYLVADNRSTPLEDKDFVSGKVTAHRQMLIKTNSFIKWGGYAELGGFPPSDLTTPLIYLLTPKSEEWAGFPEKPQKAVKVSI